MPLRRNQEQNVDLSDTVRERQKKEESWREQKFSVYEEKAPWMVRVVVKYSGGYIKTERQAYMMLWGVAITASLFAAIIFFFGVRESIDERYLYNPETDTTDDVSGQRAE